jgi:hypothetical protein
MFFKKKSDKEAGLKRSYEQSWFVQLDPSNTKAHEGYFEFDPISPPRVWSMIDFDSKTWFTLLWTGEIWVDVPGTQLTDALRAGDPSLRQVQFDFLEMFVSEASETRFPYEFLSGIEKNSQSGDPVALAEFIANKVHARQTDKCEMPYTLHPKRVADLVCGVPGFENLDEDQKSAAIQAAWLHDVLEDSGENGFPVVLQSDLYAWGISKLAVYATENLSRETPMMRNRGIRHNPDEYYEIINRNTLARLVKLADLADNCNLQRVDLMRSKGQSVDPDKYPKALQALRLSDTERKWFESAIKREVLFD